MLPCPATLSTLMRSPSRSRIVCARYSPRPTPGTPAHETESSSGESRSCSLAAGPALAQPKPDLAVPGRYQMLTQPIRPQAGGGPTVQIVVLDTVTGRCWVTNDDVPPQWRDLGAPPRGGN